ncbi:MAG: hypothetical protein ACREBG_00885 [Pyrinomonadaceae bacterium]
MTKTFCLFCLLVFCAAAAFAQASNSDRCEVSIADLKAKKSERLGTFTTVIAEEELTTKEFRLPHTNLFIVASFLYR